MRQPVQRMLMALRVLRNPTLPTPSAKHSETIYFLLHSPQPKSSRTAHTAFLPPLPSNQQHPLRKPFKRSKRMQESSPAWPRSGSRISPRTSSKNPTKQRNTMVAHSTRQGSSPLRASPSSPHSFPVSKKTWPRLSVSSRATSPPQKPSSRPPV